MKNAYEMTDLGTLKHFLGFQIKYCEAGIFLSQELYTTTLLKKHQMQDCNPTVTPMSVAEKFRGKGNEEESADEEEYRSLIGSLIYLTNSRPDIENAVNVLARYVSNPSKTHFGAAKRILRYLKGTSTYGILLKHEENTKLIGYCDSDWAGSLDDRRSTSGHVFFLGSSPISWSSRKQHTIALSTTEAEFMALNTAACEAIWLARLKKNLTGGEEDEVKLMCDNTSALALAKNPVFHARSKHIEIRFHFIREAVEKKLIHLEHCPTETQKADILTKPLHRKHFVEMRDMLGVIDGADLGGV
ncbi:hypothetical protein KSP39_PZI014001 [Platanthera zijinensis]|uniref:Uncharacterized protein n=1 Tax=Platanthera zijinensis TaxID=2320716 RepID=A0AAP0BC08_9ASPA